MAALSTIATIASLAGTAVSAIGTIAAGKAEQKAANYEAAQLDVQAKDERAGAQREAQELARRKRLALSTLTANAAGSGFTATDPTVLDLAGEIAEYGTYQEQLAMYGGTSRAEGLKASAAARRVSGAAARRGSIYSAGGTLLAGFGQTMFDRYGGGGYEGRYATARPGVTSRTGINRGYG